MLFRSKENTDTKEKDQKYEIVSDADAITEPNKISLDVSMSNENTSNYRKETVFDENTLTDWEEIASDENVSTDRKDHIPDENTADTGIKAEQTQEVPEVLPQYQSFHEKYTDLFGWLKVPGIQMDSPVMQSDDEKRGERYYYLHRDYTGRKSEEGSLFVDRKSVV